MANVIKWFTGRNLEKYDVEVFTPVKRGESSFDYQSFDGEKSVQDEARDPERVSAQVSSMLNNSVAGASFGYGDGGRPRMFSSYDDDTLPSAPTQGVGRPRLFAAYEDDDYSTPSAPSATGTDRPRLFGSYEPDGSEIDYAKQWEELRRAEQEENPDANANTLSSDKTAPEGFQEAAFENASAEDVKLPESQKEQAEKNAEIAALQQELDEAKAKIEELMGHQASMQEKIDSIPVLQEASRKEGYNSAVQELEGKEKKAYEAQQADYLSKIEKSWQEANAELAKLNDTIAALDDEMPQIVVAYVRQIIGEERKINDELVVNVVKGALSQLKDLQQIVFTVNPDDAAIMAEKFPRYGVSIDPSIPKGSVKVRTKIGEINLSVDSWVDSLEQQINEQIALAKNDQTD